MSDELHARLVVGDEASPTESEEIVKRMLSDIPKAGRIIAVGSPDDPAKEYRRIFSDPVPVSGNHPIPDGLCAVGGCVYTPHEGEEHSWNTKGPKS